MMIDFTELGPKPSKNRPFAAFSNVLLNEFETTFGIVLPNEYVDFLRFQNGGKLDLSEYEDENAGTFGRVSDFYGLGSRADDEAERACGRWQFSNLWGETRMFRELFGILGVPIARDAGDNQLFLDFRNEPPSIGRMVFAEKRSYRLADTFNEFLGKLRARNPLTRHKQNSGQRQLKIPDTKKEL
jgi:hypothetical protein